MSASAICHPLCNFTDRLLSLIPPIATRMPPSETSWRMKETKPPAWLSGDGLSSLIPISLDSARSSKVGKGSAQSKRLLEHKGMRWASKNDEFRGLFNHGIAPNKN